MNAPDDSPVLEHLIAGITVGETYFFRDKNQMHVLQDTLLPQLINAKRLQNNLCLRIWSAGCASGEEIYTLGMMLLQLLPDISSWRIQLLGTDINTRSLQKAMAGDYSEWSMRSISPYFKQLYFTHKNNHYILSDTVRHLVRFSYLNLNDNTYPSLINGTNAQDLILCRNVLIYFDNDRISSLMKKLDNSLVYGGFLLLGASDPIMIEETDLIFHHEQGLLFSRPTALQIPRLLTQPSVEKIKKIPAIPFSAKNTIRPAIQPPPKKPKVDMPNQTTISSLLSESRWEDVLVAIHALEVKGKIDSSLLNSKALAYANLGQLEQSLQTCIDSLRLDATNKHTYFTYALTLVELNRLSEAEEALRKTLFLDRHFVEGHFQLGLLLLKKGQHKTGMKSLSNALAIAEAKRPTEEIPGYQGLNYGKLAELFKHEIELYAATGDTHHANQSAQK